MPTANRGEVWLADLGFAAKVRPCLIFSVPLDPQDRWVVESVRQFRKIVDHEPPRPYGYVDQLREDIRDWRLVFFLLLGAAWIGVAFILRSWMFAILGVYWFIGLFLLLRSTVLYIRRSPLQIGVVQRLDGLRPILRDLVMAHARVPDGGETQVGLPLSLAAFVQREGPAEVLFLYEPKWPYSLVIGARMLRPNETGSNSNTN